MKLQKLTDTNTHAYFTVSDEELEERQAEWEALNGRWASIRMIIVCFIYCIRMWIHAYCMYSFNLRV